MRFAIQLTPDKLLHHDSASAHVAPRTHRITLLITLLFTAFVISVPKFDLTAIIVFAVFPSTIVISCKLPILFIVKRVALLSPFILFIAVANPILDTTPFFILHSIVISAGMISGFVILLKSIVIIVAITSLSLVIPFYRICELLGGMRVPEVFVTQLMLLYRFSFVLVNEAFAMQKARDLRSSGKKGRDLFTTAKLIGVLLFRTKYRAERIYRGMVARGFDGILSQKKNDPFTFREMALLLVTLFVFSLIRIIF